MDVVIPAGDAIQLIITQTNEDYIPSPISTTPISVDLSTNSILGLSTVQRDCNNLFLPPMMPFDYPQCTEITE
jgi:hypothetical protein